MNNSKTQVIFCTDGIFPYMVGGIQRHSRLLAEELAKNEGVDLIVIHPHEGVTVFNVSLGIKEIVLAPERTSGTYLLDCFRYSKRVLEEVEKYPGAVVYAQGLALWSGMQKVKNRTVLNPHGLEPFQGITSKDKFNGLPFRVILRKQFRSSRNVVSLGGRLTELLRKNGPAENVVVLPNAVNVPDAIPRNFANTPMKFLFVGRFAFNKGIDILATAVKELNAEGYEKLVEFNLVGKGPLFDAYVKEYDFPNLHFLGFASDPELIELYKSNDVFVLPTLFEGMPTVVLEAMAYGMPIIVTDTGATTEMVDTTNGYIIEKKDVQSLKNAILNYINLDPEKRRSMSETSYSKVKNNFTWKIVSEKHLQLFSKIKESLINNA
ncbi:MAG: glycosyltransferase family 4 protein [Bacteroidetes bacterium]|nr:glycosyltransferase family 4 protein [Bacteroidota bacterium]